MSGTTTYRWQKNRREVVLATLEEFNGHDLASIRVYAADNETGDLIPTRKGISIRVDDLWRLREAVESLLAAREVVPA